ncbi:MAG TPA: hypothetical protein VLA92_04925 [Candidatus Saccharimonadales bacterium]|nr:hypothetical protein [Candidatus Saccharimonadales bacterium]
MKRLKLILASLLFALALLPAMPAHAATDVFEGACKSKGSDSSAACQQTGGNPLTGPNGTLTKVTKLIGFIAGAAAVILMLVAGIMYVTSDGDSGKVQSAKNTMIYAAVGLVVIGVSQGIIILVLNML